MLYMVIEHYKTSGGLDVYRRARNRGRMLPEGLRYLSSWVTLDYAVCYQLMETDQPELFDAWTDAWKDLVDFEIVPVRTSAEASQGIAPLLG